MTREEEPGRIRRVLMQSIMWLILGATVGAAALVDQAKRRALNPPLGEAAQLRGVKISLPRGWEKVVDGEEDGETTAIRQDPQFGDVLVVSVRSLGFGDLFRSRQAVPGERAIKEIDLGGQPAKLMLQRTSAGEISVPELVVSRSLARGRTLSISLIVPSARGRGDITREIDLIERVAKSVEIDGNP